MKTANHSAQRQTGIISPRGLEIIAAALLLLYVLAVVVSIFARLSVTEDVTGTTTVTDAYGGRTQVTTWGLNPEGAIAGQAAALVGAFILTAAAAATVRLFAPGDSLLAQAGAFMLLGAAFFTGVSAMIGWILFREYMVSLDVPGPLTSLEGLNLLRTHFEPLRALLGKVSFTFAGLGIMAYGGLIAGSGVLPRWLGWLGLAAGLSMFFIWFENTGPLHRAGGGAYLLCLTLWAGRLLIKGTRPTEPTYSHSEETTNA